MRSGGLVEGVLECADRAVAIRQIEQQRCIPIKIDMVGGGAPEKNLDRGKPPTAPATQNLKIPHGQALIFTEQLAHLLQAGMTLDEGLSILEKRLKQPRMQQMTRALHQALVDGRSFSQSLRDFPRIFPPLYVNLVAAGEASGALPDILHRLVKHLMQAKNLRDRVQLALIYPARLPWPASRLITVFITFMVPQLTAFMSQNNATLPLPRGFCCRSIMPSPLIGGSARSLSSERIAGFRAFVRSNRRPHHVGPVPPRYSGLWPADSASLLRAIFAHAWHS